MFWFQSQMKSQGYHLFLHQLLFQNGMPAIADLHHTFTANLRAAIVVQARRFGKTRQHVKLRQRGGGLLDARDLAAHPVAERREEFGLPLQQPFFGAETASAVSSRGVYFFPVSEKKGGGFFRFQVSSYDLYAPPWANIPDHDFDSADQLPALAGEFVWTGFDYLGEPTPYNNDESNLLNFTDPEEKARLAQQLKELGRIRVPSRSSS